MSNQITFNQDDTMLNVGQLITLKIKTPLSENEVFVPAIVLTNVYDGYIPLHSVGIWLAWQNDSWSGMITTTPQAIWRYIDNSREGIDFLKKFISTVDTTSKLIDLDNEKLFYVDNNIVYRPFD